MKFHRTVWVVLALGLAMTTGRSRAAAASKSTPDRDWPSVVPTPAHDVPMRDTAIMRGPDGVYYLTGTLGVEIKNQESRIKNSLDFDNGRQIRLWKSTDLKSWTDLGVVWDQDVHVFSGGAKYPQTAWMRQSHKDPSSADSPVVHGLKSPELHHIKGNWYICFSINDQGTGLLKSSSGKPEGPYEAHAQITLRHGAPSMFADDDGSVYWLFGGGWIAKLNDDLTAIVERPRLLTTANQRPPAFARGKKGTKEFFDYPLTVGDHGVFMFKHKGRYFLTAAERTNRMNASCDDTFIAWADEVMGPYSIRQMMVPHGGGVTVFPGPRSSAVPKYYHEQQRSFLGSVSAQQRRTPAELESMKDDDTLYVSFSGNDDRAIFRDRPSFLPLEWTSPERHVHQFDDIDSFPRKPRHVITERGPWPWMKPLVDERVRDLRVLVAPNGKYYFSGAILSQPGKLYVWESDDLATWRKIGPVWTYEQIEWLSKKLEMPKDIYPDNPKASIAWNHIFWHTWINWIGDNFYITYVIFGPNDESLHKLSGLAVLRSTTGKIEGPYESLGRIGGQYGQSPEPSYPEFFRVGGQLWLGDWVNWRPVAAKVDESRLHDRAGWKFSWQLVDAGAYEQMFRGDTYNTLAIAGRPFFYFMSAGKLDRNEIELGNNTYDHHYVELATPLGPPKIGAKPQVVPHNGQANVFQDHQGRWWSSIFGSDHTAPWWEQFGLIALRVEKLPGNDLRIDVEDKPDDDQKRIMGGGKIAEIKTVSETLEERK